MDDWFQCVCLLCGWHSARLGAEASLPHLCPRCGLESGLRMELRPPFDPTAVRVHLGKRSRGEQQTQKEFREVTGIPEPEELEVELAPLKFVEPGPLAKKV